MEEKHLFADIGDYVRVTDVYVANDNDLRNYGRDQNGEKADIMVNATSSSVIVVRN